MNEIASKGQLNAALIRWALAIIPVVLLLGLGAGLISNSGEENGWYQMLQRPAIQPPGWVFGVVWPVLYVLIGLSAAMVAAARGARWRGPALSAFAVQLVLNLCWSPLFFGMHQVSAAFWLLLLILAAAGITTWLFAKVRVVAAWLLVPYLAWLCFASLLAFETDRLNPDGEIIQAPAGAQRIAI